ncbi:MAG: hypothetical protein IPL23_26785 [Saprospiraceae bacterium]|nr:hypothetical protein [Saprospiraceae bacterium]
MVYKFILIISAEVGVMTGGMTTCPIFIFISCTIYTQIIGKKHKANFLSVADQFSQTVKQMGGSATPWQKAYMNYRVWDYQTQQPLKVGVPEPEAAGAYAWLLYRL